MFAVTQCTLEGTATSFGMPSAKFTTMYCIGECTTICDFSQCYFVGIPTRPTGARTTFGRHMLHLSPQLQSLQQVGHLHVCLTPATPVVVSANTKTLFLFQTSYPHLCCRIFSVGLNFGFGDRVRVRGRSRVAHLLASPAVGSGLTPCTHHVVPNTPGEPTSDHVFLRLCLP